jgi:hypothetical protein
MMAIFEGGFFMWLALLQHGAENVWRVFISVVMLLVTGAGVGVGAYYELSGMMHKGIAAPIDPDVLAFIPSMVIIAYLATFAAIMLYILANPEFFHRMSHINRTGQAPEQQAIFPVTNFNPFADVTPALPAGNGRLALPQPRQNQTMSAALGQPGLLQRAGAKLASLFQGSRQDANSNVVQASQPSVNVTEEQAEDMQEAEHDNQQSDHQEEQQTAPPARLGLIERKMLEFLQSADPSVQDQLEQYAATHTLAELVAFLKESYPKYAGFFSERSVEQVIEVFRASRQPQPAEEVEKVPAAEMQNSAPARQASARRKPSTKTAAKAGATSSSRRGGNWQVILPLLDEKHPGKTDAELAKIAGCSQSTVSRWRTQKKPVNA